MSGFFIGIDVGGTNLKAGLTDETGRLLAAARRPLDFRGAETFAADLADLAAEVLSTAGAVPGDAEGVGIGLPGAVSGGEVLYTTNIPLERTDLAALFRRRLDLPVLLGNDADCAAVGEYFQGAGRGLRDFVVLTLGTGLGAGIILDGRLRGGESSSEAGHMVLHAGGEPCPCGRRGCWEQYASATALIRRTEAAMAAHPEVLSTAGAVPGDAEGVGIGLPGAVSGGEVLYTTNIPLERTDLAALFRRRLDLPVLLGNDADCAAVGEYFQGAGRGLRDFVVLTLGTGLGAGIILDGRLRGGESSSEAGHMVLHAGGEPCPCGRRGCWEQYASATALIRRTEAAMAAHPESALCRLAEEAGGVDGRTPFLAAEAGDETALAVCRAYVEELAEGTASLINILRPEAVAFGGGVAGAPEHLLLEPLRRRIGALCFSRHGGRATRILRAELGNDAGVIGAALLGRVI